MKTNKLTIGILAHVDAGKTTLSEGILYHSGSIKKLGRVDHGNAFLDTDDMERARGITIFSKQAQFALGNKEITLLDTPGHVDFAAEMERTLQVIDYAILVINGADGVQSHTVTLWKLLKHYGIPVFLFINKMDQVGTDRDQILNNLQKKLDESCIAFGEGNDENFLENIALCQENLMEEYLSNGEIKAVSIATAIKKRKIFPCFFGAALKSKGIDEFLKELGKYTILPEYSEQFGAKIYKITRDNQGNRLTHMKITGGGIKVKDLVGDDKVEQIRIYSGGQYKVLPQVEAGTICAVTGLSKTRSGEGIGVENWSAEPILEPVLSYKIQLPKFCDVHGMLIKLKQLEEESPQLRIVWNEQLNEIHAQLMGEIEIEILKTLILERYGVEVEFGSGNIVYKESILEPVLGVGHFEPLKHYAEVHVVMEPSERGSGLSFESNCSENMLEKNWQRLVLSHLGEKKHRGVLVGAEITDIKISLVAGRGHEKHTEGGDFRQATFRAIRQGLKKAKSILLEPVYEFQLEVPTAMVGRALSDIQRMNGKFEPPKTEGEISIIEGTAPVVLMNGYQREVASYTKGEGRIQYTLSGYEPCHNQAEVIANVGYDSEQDIVNPTSSIFCSQGAGFSVNWNEVEKHMHVDSGWNPETLKGIAGRKSQNHNSRGGSISGIANEKELEEIFTRTYGPIKRDPNIYKKTIEPSVKIENTGWSGKGKPYSGTGEKYLLVDGYNIIFAWDELKELAKVSLEGARNQLLDILSNYQGYKRDTLIVVFDAYKVIGGKGSVMKYDDLHVIYTKEAETADQYIERTVHKMEQSADITVATSDNMVQMIVWGNGAKRLSAEGLRLEVEAVNQQIRNSEYVKNKGSKNFALEKLGETINELEVKEKTNS